MVDPAPASFEESIRTLQRDGALSIPPPAGGASAERLRALYQLGRRDLSIARICEAHTDALAILAEANRSNTPGALYGVWASDGPGGQLQMRPVNESFHLTGSKQYCSGAPFLDRALVTAHGADSLWLIDLPLDTPGIRVESSGWATPAFAATGTSTVSFEDVAIDQRQLVGPSNWYLERVGFWHGAVGPAACWAGGAAGLVDAALLSRRRDAHARAQLGALDAAEWGLRALLDQVAAQMDADPDDRSRAQHRGLVVRHLIERACTDILDRFGRVTGPQLLAFDPKLAQRYSELTLYIRQCHAERDLESLADTRSAWSLPGPTDSAQQSR